jgi:hypothetical protein
MNRSPNVSRAGGQGEFIDDIDDQHIAHAAKPHVYVMYWPEFGIIKAGVTGVGNPRWNSWLRHGAVLLMIGDTCCMEHARRIEGFLLNELSRFGGRAFTGATDARAVLGKHKGGWTECYRLVQSPRFGEAPEGSFDYERAYGLILPVEFPHRVPQLLADPSAYHHCMAGGVVTEPEFEWGVEWTWRDGRVFVSAGYREDAAKLMADLCSNPKEHNPHATGVVRRPVAAWSPVPPEGKQATT